MRKMSRMILNNFTGWDANSSGIDTKKAPCGALYWKEILLIPVFIIAISVIKTAFATITT